MAQVSNRPVLSVDVNVGPTASRAPTTSQQARAQAQARASATVNNTSQFDDANDDNQQAAQGGFSSDEDGAGQDAYAAATSRLKAGAASSGAKATKNSLAEKESNDVYNVNQQVSQGEFQELSFLQSKVTLCTCLRQDHVLSF